MHDGGHDVTAGNWQLDLALGRSRDMFEMVGGALRMLLHAGQNNSAHFSILPSSPVLVHSFSGLHTRLLLRKKDEFRGQDVLQVCPCLPYCAIQVPVALVYLLSDPLPILCPVVRD